MWGLKSRAKAVDLLKLNRAIYTYPGNAALTNPGQVTYGYSHGGYYDPYCDCTVYLGSSWISLLAMQKLAECDYTYNNMTGVSLTWLFEKSVQQGCTVHWTERTNTISMRMGKGELNCYVLPLGQMFKVRKCYNCYNINKVRMHCTLSRCYKHEKLVKKNEKNAKEGKITYFFCLIPGQMFKMRGNLKFC